MGVSCGFLEGILTFKCSALTAELIAHQLRLAELLRQSATLAAVEALAHNAISSVVTASTKVGNLVKVWSIVCAVQC